MDDGTAHQRARRGAARRAWDAVGSLRLAVVLLVVIAIASVVGIVLPQPESFESDPYIRLRLDPRSEKALTDEALLRLARAAALDVPQGEPSGFLRRARTGGLPEDDYLRLRFVDSFGTVLGRGFLALSIHRAFRSLWYRLLCLALVVNLVACSTRRVGGQWRAAFGTRASKDATWYERRAIHASLTVASGVDAAADAAAAALRQRGFRIRRRRATGLATLDAARGWLGALGRLWWPLGYLVGAGRLGSQVVHLGVVLIVIGGFVSGRLSFRHAQTMAAGEEVVVPDVSERLGIGYQLRQAWHDLRARLDRGFERPVTPTEAAATADWRRPETLRLRPAFRLRLRDFEARFDSRGKPEYYGAHVAIADAEPPIDATIEVNRPLVYRGYHVYQQGYGRHFVAALIAARMPAGEPPAGGTGQDPRLHTLRLLSLPGTVATLRELGLTLRVLRFAPHLVIPLERGPDGRTVVGEPYNASDELVNPAMQVLLQAEGHEPRVRWLIIPFGQHRSPHPVDYAGLRLLVHDARLDFHTVLAFRTHPVLFPVWVGCGLMMAGIVLCFYCNHERVWALVRLREDGGCDVHLAGNAFKWRDRFRERFEALVAALREHAADGSPPDGSPAPR